MFPTKVLLAVDGSEEAFQAARTAVALARKTGSELHVAYVEPLPDPYALPESSIHHPEMRDEIRAMARREATERIGEEAKRVGTLGEVAGTHPLIGRPDVEIPHLAEELGAGLIVLGSRGLGFVRRTLMGSVSHSVVRHAHGPVLVVREGDEVLPDRILLAVDGSAESGLAVAAAADLSEKTGAEVHVAYVLPTPAQLYGPHYYSPEMKDRLLEQAEEKSHEFLDRQARKVKEAGGRVAGTHLATGRPEAEIVRLAGELGTGLTVLGSRGLGGVRRALLGSVSDAVVRHAHNPVLVVREDGTGDE